jgi:hypothetical protein
MKVFLSLVVSFLVFALARGVEDVPEANRQLSKKAKKQQALFRVKMALSPMERDATEEESDFLSEAWLNAFRHASSQVQVTDRFDLIDGSWGKEEPKRNVRHLLGRRPAGMSDREWIRLRWEAWLATYHPWACRVCPDERRLEESAADDEVSDDEDVDQTVGPIKKIPVGYLPEDFDQNAFEDVFCDTIKNGKFELFRNLEICDIIFEN